jgi:hypothetical protein
MLHLSSGSCETKFEKRKQDMGLFDQIIGAVNNPHQQASPDQLGAILNTVEGLAASRGVDSGVAQTALSAVGSYVRSALQQQRETAGSGQAEAIVNQFGGTSPSTAAVEALFTPNQQQQVAQGVAQRTGISSELILSLLPMLVPLVLNLLKSGSTAQSAPAAGAPGSNPVLNSFLDADHDGDVDVADAIAMAGRYLSQPR